MIRDQYPNIYYEDDISIITIVKNNPLSPISTDRTPKLGKLISAIYYSRYGLNIFRGEGSATFTSVKSGTWTGGVRSICHFPTSAPQVPLIGKIKSPRIRAYLGDMFILHKNALTFIPAEIIKSLQWSATQEKENK